MDDPRPLMVEIAHLMYDRFLTNSAGGNISCRLGGRVYITPRRLGSVHRWQLHEDMILVFDLDMNVLVGDAGLVSRESRLHFACYRHLPQVNGVIHAHPRYLGVLAATGQSLPSTCEYTDKFGEVEVVPPLPSHSAELADTVVRRLLARRATLERNGLGLILARHGAVTVGHDLADAYDVLERLEWSAHTWLMSRAAGLEVMGDPHHHP